MQNDPLSAVEASVGIPIAMVVLVLALVLAWTFETERKDPMILTGIAVVLGGLLSIWLALDSEVDTAAIRDYLEIAVQVLIALVIALAVEHLVLGDVLDRTALATIVLSVVVILPTIAFSVLALIPELPGGGCLTVTGLVLSPGALLAGLMTLFMLLAYGFEAIGRKNPDQ